MSRFNSRGSYNVDPIGTKPPYFSRYDTQGGGGGGGGVPANTGGGYISRGNYSVNSRYDTPTRREEDNFARRDAYQSRPENMMSYEERRYQSSADNINCEHSVMTRDLYNMIDEAMDYNIANSPPRHTGYSRPVPVNDYSPPKRMPTNDHSPPSRWRSDERRGGYSVAGSSYGRANVSVAEPPSYVRQANSVGRYREHIPPPPDSVDQRSRYGSVGRGQERGYESSDQRSRYSSVGRGKEREYESSDQRSRYGSVGRGQERGYTSSVVDSYVAPSHGPVGRNAGASVSRYSSNQSRSGAARGDYERFDNYSRQTEHQIPIVPLVPVQNDGNDDASLISDVTEDHRHKNNTTRTTYSSRVEEKLNSIDSDDDSSIISKKMESQKPLKSKRVNDANEEATEKPRKNEITFDTRSKHNLSDKGEVIHLRLVNRGGNISMEPVMAPEGNNERNNGEVEDSNYQTRVALNKVSEPSHAYTEPLSNDTPCFEYRRTRDDSSTTKRQNEQSPKSTKKPVMFATQFLQRNKLDQYDKNRDNEFESVGKPRQFGEDEAYEDVKVSKQQKSIVTSDSESESDPHKHVEVNTKFRDHHGNTGRESVNTVSNTRNNKHFQMIGSKTAEEVIDEAIQDIKDIASYVSEESNTPEGALGDQVKYNSRQLADYMSQYKKNTSSCENDVEYETSKVAKNIDTEKRMEVVDDEETPLSLIGRCRWRANDIIGFEPDTHGAEASVACLAAAYLLVYEDLSDSFEDVVRSVASILDKNRTIVSKGGVMPFQMILRKVGQIISAEAKTVHSNSMSIAEFWSRCALFAAIATMKTCNDHTDPRVLMAAEAILNYCSIKQSKNWLDEVDCDLKDAAARVRNVLMSGLDGDESVASLVSVAIQSGGQKCLALERIIRDANHKDEEPQPDNAEIEMNFSDQEEETEIEKVPSDDAHISQTPRGRNRDSSQKVDIDEQSIQKPTSEMEVVHVASIIEDLKSSESVEVVIEPKANDILEVIGDAHGRTHIASKREELSNAQSSIADRIKRIQSKASKTTQSSLMNKAGARISNRVKEVQSRARMMDDNSEVQYEKLVAMMPGNTVARAPSNFGNKAGLSDAIEADTGLDDDVSALSNLTDEYDKKQSRSADPQKASFGFTDVYSGFSGIKSGFENLFSATSVLGFLDGINMASYKEEQAVTNKDLMKVERENSVNRILSSKRENVIPRKLCSEETDTNCIGVIDQRSISEQLMERKSSKFTSGATSDNAGNANNKLNTHLSEETAHLKGRKSSNITQAAISETDFNQLNTNLSEETTSSSDSKKHKKSRKFKSFKCLKKLMSKSSESASSLDEKKEKSAESNDYQTGNEGEKMPTYEDSMKKVSSSSRTNSVSKNNALSFELTEQKSKGITFASDVDDNCEIRNPIARSSGSRRSKLPPVVSERKQEEVKLSRNVRSSVKKTDDNVDAVKSRKEASEKLKKLLNA